MFAYEARRLEASRSSALAVKAASPVLFVDLSATQYGADPCASAFSSRAGVSSSPAMERQEHLEARAALAGCHPRFYAEGRHRAAEVDRIPALSILSVSVFLVGRLAVKNNVHLVRH